MEIFLLKAFYRREPYCLGQECGWRNDSILGGTMDGCEPVQQGRRGERGNLCAFLRWRIIRI